MDRDEFFAQLDLLTPKEIEARVPSWDKEQLILVQQYLEQRRAKPRQSDQAASDAAWAATEMAMKANARATLSLIVSLCALLAAVTSAVVGFLGLQH